MRTFISITAGFFAQFVSGFLLLYLAEKATYAPTIFLLRFVGLGMVVAGVVVALIVFVHRERRKS